MWLIEQVVLKGASPFQTPISQKDMQNTVHSIGMWNIRLLQPVTDEVFAGPIALASDLGRTKIAGIKKKKKKAPFLGTFCLKVKRQSINPTEKKQRRQARMCNEKKKPSNM